MSYYFLGILLPKIEIGKPPEMSFQEFNTFMKDNLRAGDYQKLLRLRHLYDIANLRFYWKEAPLGPYGTFNLLELEDALATRTMLPGYVFAFLDQYLTNEMRLLHYSQLLGTFFQEEIKKSSGIIQGYYKFEREVRLTLLAFRAKSLQRDLEVELQYEDKGDEIIVHIMEQKDAYGYQPLPQYADLKNIIQDFNQDPIILHKALLEYRFNRIEEMFDDKFFSIDRFAGYMLQLIMAERFYQMNHPLNVEMAS